ncbi:DUF1254 domain-containing protein [Vibrio maerlii]|uniref:DUF1254 domain-containing protein n=1 Tax=Vibrio maerlii TaxID=2231648 RepID=UPI000E3C2995|nr:DUF1214 domain-containing protein [Vibrio maerlii]
MTSFKMSIKTLVAMAALASVGFSAHAVTPQQARDIAEEAYIFSYPMLENYKTLYNQTQNPDYKGYVGGFAEYKHYSKPFTPDDIDVVTPNNDTTYSWAWLDLRREPIVFSTPDLDDASRFNAFQWWDLFTHNFTVEGSRISGMEGKTVLIAGPNWNGEKPADVDKVFYVESNFVGTLTRTNILGDDDTTNIKALQREYDFTPLSAWNGEKPPAPVANIEFPVWSDEKAKTAEFIEYMNFLLTQVDQDRPDYETEVLNTFKEIGLEAGKEFNIDEVDSEIVDAINAGIQDAFAKLKKRGKTNKSNIGIFGDRAYYESLGDDKYEARAIGTLLGLYGMNESEAVYFSYQIDDAKQRLSGENTYTIHFSKEELPPVSQFWSFTMYQLPSQLLVENEIDRYSIGDRTEGLTYDEDGGLTITISNQKPSGDVAVKNWLPSPDGYFYMVARLYGPDAKVVTGEWVRPELHKQ